MTNMSLNYDYEFMQDEDDDDDDKSFNYSALNIIYYTKVYEISSSSPKP